MFKRLFILPSLLLATTGVLAQTTAEPASAPAVAGATAEEAAPAPSPRVLLRTSEGDITIELAADKAPKSVANFLRLRQAKHYDGTVFHRVIDNFMVQGGGFDPDLKQKPTRPPVENEADNGLSNMRGTVAMARTNDPHSATSQFFINVVDNNRPRLRRQGQWLHLGLYGVRQGRHRDGRGRQDQGHADRAGRPVPARRTGHPDRDPERRDPALRSTAAARRPEYGAIQARRIPRWERRGRRDRPHALPQRPIAHRAARSAPTTAGTIGARRSPVGAARAPRGPATLPRHRSPIALHAALLQQPAAAVLAATLWERRVRRDRPRTPPQRRSPIALHAALLQQPSLAVLAATWRSGACAAMP